MKGSGSESRWVRYPGRIRQSLRGLAIVLPALFLACGDSSPAEPPTSVPASVAITPSSVTFAALGQTAQLTATVLDQSGQSMQGVTVVWSTSAGSVVTVNAAGLVTAIGNGDATVTATVQGGDASGSAGVTVAQQAQEIQLSRTAGMFRALGDTLRLSANALDANGNAIADVGFVWSSSDASVVAVDSTGLVTATGNGSASVLATSGPARGRAEFTVEQEAKAVLVSPVADTLRAFGDTVQLSAELVDANGHPVAGATGGFAWSSDDPGVATVNATGLVTAAGNGSAGITVVSESGISGLATVTVTQEAAAARVSPATDTLRALGDTLRLSAEVVDGNGHAITDADGGFTWSSDDEAVAAVDATGLVTAVGNGSTRVTAMANGGLSATAAVVVMQRATSIQLSPAADTLLVPLGDTLRLSAEVFDANLQQIEAAELVWSSSDDAVAVVEGTGLVRGIGAGSATVTVASGTISASVVVNVASTPAEVRIYPAADTLRALGDTLRLRAVAFGVDGNPVGESEFTWWSADKSIAVVDGTGLVTAISVGSVEITAGLTGTDLTGVARLEVIVVDERAALSTLYHGTGGPNWHQNGNWLTDASLGSWHGVTTNAQGRVTRLSLQYNNLRGSIPAELGYLPELTRLELHRNELTGSIPPELGRLTNLEHVDFNTNRFEGPIPKELGNLTNLIYLRLSSNYLEGPIPPEFGNLTNLQGLFLHRNRDLKGSIPRELGNLANLSNLWLAENKLAGPIPSELGRLSNLDTLYLSRNQLTGEIPPELGDLNDLKFLHINDNQLTGPIPPELGRLGSLTWLNLGGNNLTGPIPLELGNLTNLTDLYFSSNRLTGAIPPQLGKLANLGTLDLGRNSLTGPIPPELGRLGSLTWLILGGNNLTGSIPPELGDMANLGSLYLYDNQLTGSIPPELGSLARLSTLSLAHNNLSGSVPAELGNLQDLTSLYLQVNELAGPLPHELINLSLRTFRWHETELCAPTDPAFQAWLGNIPFYHHGENCFLDPRDALMALLQRDRRRELDQQHQLGHRRGRVPLVRDDGGRRGPSHSARAWQQQAVRILADPGGGAGGSAAA